MEDRQEHFYFIGICGTAMGSVAAAFRDIGYRISGSDTGTYDPMKSFLEDRGIVIEDENAITQLPDDVDFFVIGNARSRGNSLVEEVLAKKLPFVSLPQLMRERILQGRRNFVVTGTHGKTTTSSMLAWLLESAGKNPNFVIGGLPANFDQGARFTSSEFSVIEGDEYDSAFFDKRSKFVHYHPEVALVNNIEFDHADIFDDLGAIKRSFGHMLRLVPKNGLIVINGDDENSLEVAAAEAHAPIQKVGFGDRCDRQISGVAYEKNATVFRLKDRELKVRMNGEYNVRNAAMAAVAGRFAGLEWEEIQNGLTSFSGIKRRQEIRGIVPGRNITIVDDFGHHPTAIGEAIEGMRHRFSGARLWAVFEPRSNTTRRKVFQESLPKALSRADAVCLTQVDRVDQLSEEERLDPNLLMEALRETGKPAFYEPDADAIVCRLQAEAADNDVIIVFSNGGFGGIHEKLLESL